MKRGPKPTPGITTSMYFDYCTGLSIPQVADSWGYQPQNVYNRFRRMGLPLRPVKEKCTCGKRNPHQLTKGVTFEDSNRERTRIAVKAHTAEIAAVLPTVTNPRWREVLEARLAHPDKNLAELGGAFDPPMSKDAIASVLRRAMHNRSRPEQVAS